MKVALNKRRSDEHFVTILKRGNAYEIKTMPLVEARGWYATTWGLSVAVFCAE